MADNVDPIVIPIQTDDKESLMSIAQVQAAIGELSSQLNTLKQQSESPMADYTRDFNQQISFAEHGLTRLLDLRKRVDSATTSTDRTRTTKVFEDEYKRMEAVVGDLQKSMSTSKALFASLTDGLEKEFTEGIRAFAPKIKQAFRQMADSITKSSGTAGDDSLIELFQHSDVYKNTMKSLQARNSTAFSNANMRSYLQSIISTAVPQYDRGKFVDWAKNEYAVKTVREMLPKAFGTIQLSGEKTYSPFQQRTKSLSSSETLALQDFIKKNPYVANELEQAGIMRRYNGVAYFNPNTKRANVNAFAGLMASMFEAGARGGPSSGITNIEDPAFQQKIVRKSNMFMNNSMRVATQLADMFPWLNPQHMEVPQTTDFRPSVNGKPGNWRTLGEYRAKPRQTAMEFYEFGLDELGADGQIAFKDGKAKYTRVNNSLMQSALSSRQGATKFTHNGFNDNEVYLSLPVGELSDYETTPERKKELQQQISRAISQTPTIGGYRYKFGGFTPTHAVYEREDLYDQIIKESPNFFMNGEDRRVFSSYKDFSKALEATRKLRTEGEDIRTLYGSDLSNARVVVARMKDITGLDGQNWIDSGLVPETFQGRDVGGKATFSKVDIAALWKMYPQLVDKTTGDLVLPTGGVNGGQLVIPKGTSIIEDIENIKTKHQYDNLSQDEINRLRTEEIRTNGIFAKTTADAAATNPRFISSQAAGTMHFGADARRYFNNVFLHELASLEDVGSVKELLFSGDDALSRMVQQDEGFLNTEEARKRIDEYRESLFAHAGKGDILIPRGSANYAMISAWLPDVMARLIPEDQLTDEQKSWRLADINKRTGLIAGSGTESEDVISKVAYFASKADELGLYRNPATASGNIKISNAAINDGMKSIATALGVDTSALYVDPKSVILKLMQGADEDGDTAFVTALKNNKEFGDIMSQVLIDTASAYKKMRELGGRTDEQQERVKELYSKDLEFNQSEFNIGNADDVASWWVGSKLAGMKMGAANAVSVGARQFRPSQRITRAILDAESHYDVDSTGRLKNAKEWEMTEDEKRVLYSGAPFFQIANWAKKSVTEDTDEEGKQRIIFDQDAFNRRAIDKVNFASINDPHALLSEYSSFMAHIMHPEAKSEFNWDAIMGALPQVDQNTATGKLTSRLRELKQGRLNNEFLFFDDDIVNELSALKTNALTEIISEVYRDKNISSKEKQIEIKKRFANAGGTVVDNLLQFGLTRRNIEANPELKKEFEFLQSLTDGSGVNLFAAAKDYTVSTEGVASYPEYIQKEQAKVEQQIAEKEKTLQQLQQAFSNDQQSQQQQEAIRRIDNQIALEKNKLESNRQERIQQYLDSVTGTEEEGSFFTSDFPAEIPSKEELQRQIAEANTQLEVAKKNSEAHKKEAENYFKSIDDDNPETKRSIDIENRIKQTEAEDARQIKFLENSLTNYQQQLNDYYGALTSPELESLQMQRAELVGQIPQEQQAIQQQTQALNQEIAALQQQRNGLAQQNVYTQEYETVQAEYNRLMSDAGQFSSELFKSVMSKQNKIDGVSRAKTFYDSQHGIANAYLSKMQNVMESGLLQDTQLQDMMKVYQRISTNVDKEFAAKAILNSKYLSEDLEQKATPAGGIWGKQEQELDAYLDKLKEAEEYKNILLGLAADPNTDKQSQDDFKAAADKVDEYLKHASEQYDKYKEKLTLNNQIMEAQRIERENAQVDQFVLRGQQMSFSKSGTTRNDIFSKMQQQQLQIVSQYASYISSGEGMLSELKKKHLDQAVGSKEYITTANNIEKLSAALANAKVEMESFQGTSGLAKIAIAQLGATTQQVITQFGRRMFQKAIQETKRFVQEYDKDMTTIQMITLKSDSEIGDLGQNLIQKAVDMRASVSETTSAAAELYRQGLSDEEVNTRLEDVIKFSKVAGIKTTEASKIITTALQNGLVDTSEDAMDALVALGDSAATTASEIAKGMQKTAASAKQAGISYSQLVTLLTIGTSKTQLGGSAIGSALQTLFYRLQKVGKKEDFYDENGKHIASNDAMKAIEGLGISAFDTEGNMRNPYEVLVDIASRWDTADDVTQSKILTTLGAGRQRSNVATLIQGLSEDNGELAGKYNDLASNSKGITDEKYQEYLKSLEASITSVKTSFDQLIASFNAGSTASTVLGFIAELIQGFTAVNTALGGMPSLITAIAVAASGLIALFKFSTPIGWITTIAAGAATVIGGIGSIINYNKKAEEERKQTELEASPEYQAKEKYEKQIALNQTSHGYESLIEETRKLGEQYNTLGENMDQADLVKFESNLKTLTARFPELGVAISADSDLLKNWSDIVNGASLSVEQFHRLQALQAADEYAKTMFADDIEELNTKVNEIKNAKDEISSSMKDLQEKGFEFTDLDERFGEVGEHEKVQETKALNQDYNISKLLSDLKTCQELCNNIANSELSPIINTDASNFVSSLYELLSSLNSMPEEGYDLSTSFEGLDLSQLSSDATTIKTALEMVQLAAKNGYIDETEANKLTSALEFALNTIQAKIDEFNSSGDNTVEVDADTKQAEDKTDEFTKKPREATITGKAETKDANAQLDAAATGNNSDGSREAKYTADDNGTADVLNKKLNDTSEDRKAYYKIEEDGTLTKVKQTADSLDTTHYAKLTVTLDKEEAEQQFNAFLEKFKEATGEDFNIDEFNPPEVKDAFVKYVQMLMSGEVRGIEEYLNKTGTYWKDFILDYNAFIDSPGNSEKGFSDYRIETTMSYDQIKQTITDFLHKQYGLSSRDILDSFIRVAQGPVATDFNYSSTLNKNNSLDTNLASSVFNTDAVVTASKDIVDNFVNKFKDTTGVDLSSAVGIVRGFFGGDTGNRSLSLNELSYLLSEKNVENANPLWLALNSTKLGSNNDNERFINYEGIETNLVFDEKKFEEALRFIYAYDLTTSGNHMFNTSSYNNADEFVADWNNGFSNFSFVQGLEGTDPKTYILGLLQKLLTGANEGDWSDYDVNMDKMVEELYTGMFATIIKKYPVDKVITGDYAGYSDLIMENIGKKILDDHEGQKLADWFNPSDILTQIFSYLNEFSLDPEAYIKDLKVETVKTSSSLLQTAIGAFETKNDSQISADKLYKELLGSEVKNLNDVMNLYDKGELKDLATVILDDQKGILGQVLAAFTEETEDGLKVIDENGVGLQAFLAALAGLTNLYKDAANETLSNIAVEAKDYLDNRTSTSYDSFKSLVGASLAIKYQNGETISPIETSYVNDIINNAANGISGLTDMQQYEGIKQLVNLVSSGGFDYNSIDSKVLGAYTSGSKTLNDYLVYSSKLTEAGLDASNLQNMSPMTDEFEEYNRVLKAAGTSARSFIETQKQLDQELATVGVTAVNEYGSQTKEVTSIIASMKGSTQSAIQEQQKLNKLLSSAASNQYYRNQWRSGKRDKETYEAIAGMLNIDKGQIDVIGEELINNMLESLSNLDLSQIQTYGYAIGEMMTQSLQDAVANEKIDLTTAGIDVHNGPVTLNIGETLAKLGGILDEETEALLKLLQQWGVDAAVKIEEDADGNIKARIQIKTVGSGRGGGQYRSGAGSGGSGNKGSTKKEKTPAEKLTEALKNRQTLWDHRIKMVQFQQTHYEEDDQLGNYGRMIEAENAIRKEMGPALEENLRELKAEFAQTAQNTKEWYTLRDAILSAEEAIEDNNQAIEKNNKKLKQNEYNIHKRRIELEDLVREEIKRRIQEERDKVQGSSDLEKEIYNIIKSNYEKQWQLIKDDIDKKKEALNEEKNLINERLNARKKAEDTASKYEQLAEYKKQLALIQMDKTRTKEAAALRKKIAELQGTIGWNIAEEEAKNQQDEIDQQVKAYDDYEKQGDKALNDFLSDANNLAAEIKQVMSLNHDDLIIWLKTNSDDYKNSLENTRQTIQFGWDDLFNKAHGIVETFNEQIAAILTNQETYIEFMSQSSEYLRATSDAQANMVQDWLDKYDAWYKTQDHSATYVHYDNNYYSNGSVVDTDNDSSGSSGSSGGGGGGGYYDDSSFEYLLPTSTQSKKVGYVVYDEKGFKTNLGGTAESEDAALESLKKTIGKSTYYSGSTDGGTSYHVKREHSASYDGKIGYGDSKESAKNALLNQLGRTVQDYLYNNSSQIQYDYSYVGVTKYKNGTVNEERLDENTENLNTTNSSSNTNTSSSSNSSSGSSGSSQSSVPTGIKDIYEAMFDSRIGFSTTKELAKEDLYAHLSDAQKRYLDDHPDEIEYDLIDRDECQRRIKEHNRLYYSGQLQPKITEYPVNNNEDGIIDLNANNNSSSGNSGSSGGSSDSQANNTITRGNNGNTRPSYRGDHGWIAQNDKGVWLYAYGFSSQRAAKADLESVINNASSTKAEYYRRSGEFYKNGGLVDYTGPAWVDGTPSAPEAFLSAPDTKLMRNFLDALSYVPNITRFDPSMFMGNYTSGIDNVSIVINEATINDELDMEILAEKIGQQFNRELEKQGFSTAKYRF